MSTTLLQLQTETYNILNDLDTSSVFSETFITQVINDAITEICDSWKWNFLRKKYLANIPQTTALNSSVSTTDLTIALDNTTNFVIPGAIWVNHDVINYTNTSSTILTGVTNIDISHVSGEKVYPLFPIPSDYSKQMALYVGAPTSVRPLPWKYINEFETSDWINNRVYSLIHDKNGNVFLWINTDLITAGDICMFHYLKTPLVLSSSGDICTIPDPYALKVIPKYAAALALLLRGDDVDSSATNLMAIAKQEVLNMQKKFGEQEQGYSRLVASTYNLRHTEGYAYRNSSYY